MKKIFSTIASFGLVASLVAPVGFAADFEISGNGDGSTNVINNTSTDTTTVKQSNTTNATVTVNASSNTGGNTANSNTGGGVTINTGSATTTVMTTVIGGSNEATLPSCGCEATPPSGLISGNGVDSTNVINNTQTKSMTVKQKTLTTARVRVNAKAKTGNNTASSNTGPGVVEITTSNAETTVDTMVEGGSNTLNP